MNVKHDKKLDLKLNLFDERNERAIVSLYE